MALPPVRVPGARCIIEEEQGLGSAPKGFPLPTSILPTLLGSHGQPVEYTGHPKCQRRSHSLCPVGVYDLFGDTRRV